MPSLTRSDYVLNSNDSYWLVNASAPLTDFPRIIGPTDQPQGWRTRMGYKAMDELIATKHRAITAADMEAMLLDDRDYVGELVMPDIAPWCKVTDSSQPGISNNDLTAACRVLLAWDRKDSTTSAGATFFREFWRKAMRVTELWHQKFDDRDPLHTPADLNLADPTVSKAIAAALGETIKQFRSLGILPNAALGPLQQRVTQRGLIALPGGPNFEGILNNLTTGPLTRSGYDMRSISGSSYMEVVTWSKGAPVADALLTYGQSSSPDSSQDFDQTQMYEMGKWVRLPFSEKAILGDPHLVIENVAN